MTKISVAVATFNEEENIERCLKSVVDLADEIVVVDGKSSDKTVEIVKKYTSKIIITNNLENFHINKMKAIKACQGKWILQLDADEIISKELKDEIIDVCGKLVESLNNKTVNGYWIPRSNYFLGTYLKKGGQYPDYTMRLYRNGKAKLPCLSVHEQAVVEGESKYLKNPLLHFSNADFSHYLIHFNLYTNIFAQEMIKKNLKINFNSFIQYLFLKPFYWFIITYFRHKGFMDKFPGFVFSIFSSLRFPVSYIKFWEIESKLREM